MVAPTGRTLYRTLYVKPWVKEPFMRGKWIFGVVLTTCLLAPAAGASAAGAHLVDFGVGLTTGAPGAATGLRLHVAFRAPGDANAKPSPIRAVVLHLPDGLRFNNAAVAQCTASDAELHALGTAACPAASQIALGSFSAITGFGPPIDPFLADNHVFNSPHQLIELITLRGTGISPGFDRLTINHSTLTAHPPSTPGGPPDGETATRSIDFNIPALRSPSGALITTPPTCPPSRTWVSTGTFTFANGAKARVTSTTRCDRAKRTAAPHRRRTGHGRRSARGPSHTARPRFTG